MPVKGLKTLLLNLDPQLCILFLDELKNTDSEFKDKYELLQKKVEGKMEKFATEEIEAAKDVLKNKKSIPPQDYVRMAKVLCQSGNVEESIRLLKENRSEIEADAKINYQAQWGLLTALILARKDEAVDHAEKMRALIEEQEFDNTFQRIQHRVWLLNYALLAYTISDKSPFINFFKNDEVNLLDEKYLAAVEGSCPTIFRYMVASCIISRRRKKQLDELTQILNNQPKPITDPILKFIDALFIRTNFDEALEILGEIKQDIESDWFLQKNAETLIENGKIIAFETYARVHKRLQLSNIAKKFQLDDAEKWVVDVIGYSKLNPTVSGDFVLVEDQQQDIYNLFSERADKNKSRNEFMANAMEKKNSSKRTKKSNSKQ